MKLIKSVAMRGRKVCLDLGSLSDLYRVLPYLFRDTGVLSSRSSGRIDRPGRKRGNVFPSIVASSAGENSL